MQLKLVILCSFLLLLTAALAWGEQVCSDKLPLSTPDENFMIVQEGTLLGKNTGLVWMRCSLGQSWDGESCQGQGKLFTWIAALKAANHNQYAGFKDWRLPNKNELESLVELSCSLPAINATLFPQTPRGFFWSSSPYSGVADGAWSVDFAYGAVVASEKSGKNHVRLVRDW